MALRAAALIIHGQELPRVSPLFRPVSMAARFKRKPPHSADAVPRPPGGPNNQLKYPKEPNDKKWVAKIVVNSNADYLGSYSSEEEAARAYDERAQALGMPVNFPSEGQKRAKSQGKSLYRGVTRVGKNWKPTLAQKALDAERVLMTK